MIKIILLLLAIILVVKATPSKEQFKPFAFELEGNKGVIVSCKLLNCEKKCIEAKVAVRTTNDAKIYTNTLNLNSLIGDKPIYFVAGTSYGENKFAIAVVSKTDKFKVSVITFTVSSGKLYADKNTIVVINVSESQQIKKIDITALEKDTRTFVVAISTLEKHFHVTFDQSYYTIFDIDFPWTAQYVTSNYKGVVLTAYKVPDAPDCDKVYNYVHFYDGLVISDYIDFDDTIACHSGSDQIAFIKDDIYLYARIDGNDGVISLTRFSNSHKKKQSSTSLSKKYSNNKIDLSNSVPLDYKLDSNNKRYSVDITYLKLNVTTNSTNVVKSIGITVAPSSPLTPSLVTFTVSYEECPNINYGTCYIKGFQAVANLDIFALSVAKDATGELIFPSVVSSNLGHDRITIGDVTLLRYSSPCLDTNL